MSTIINEGDLCFDVGCHWGRKAKTMRQCGAKVIGIEPEPLMHKMLGYEFSRDQNFTLVPAGLSNQQGTMTLYRSSNLSMNSFVSDWSETTDGKEVTTSFEVEVTTLDRLIERYGTPKYCKIDVEGYEESVLSGLTRPIDLISFEFHANQIERAINCLQYLQNLGSTAANITPEDSTTYLFPEYVPFDEIIEFLLHNWNHGTRGDIYIRSA